MKFGMVMPHFGAFASTANIASLAALAEDGGFESVWVADHIIISREFVDRFSDRVYEAFTTLGYLAGITQRVRLGTSVLVLPYRHPITLAKQMATLDQLSGGRTIFGIGFGWLQAEYEALDVPFAKRGRRADEMVQIIDQLWRGGDNGFEGEFYQFEDFAFEPLPVQQPRPPIWVGGNNERAVERAVRYGDGWHPITSAKRPGSVQWTIDDLERRLALLDRLAGEAGREPAAIERSLCMPLAFDMDPTPFLGDAFALVGSADTIRRNLRRCVDLGIEHIILMPWYTIPGLVHETDADSIRRTLERFADEVMPEFVS